MTPDRALALTHFPAPLRDAVEAVLRLDATLAEVVAATTEPMIGTIRLAWWREALEKLDREPAPAEPRLAALAEHVLPRGVTGEMLALIEDGYATLLEPQVDVHRVGQGGAALFWVISTLLGGDDGYLGKAGAIAMLARVRGMVPDDVAPTAHALMRDLKGHRFPVKLRPLTLLARLAARDFLRREPEPEATPGRAFAMLSHRLSGIVSGAN
ncbi:squalene/phytoene synthase family protein [Sphingomicrobium arenosum]|uniref:squalene/phytoene synthase family protein n=1 Tax=Sphingomicrobium arenosum TaxID=2233861 RepID=UPI002240DEAC|nr:squalene/phytoene synthase family protein [Sphingomicrobium arenosum]